MKNIILTGASKGLGLVILKRLLAEDYYVFAVSRSVTDELEKLQVNNKEKLAIIEYDLENVKNINKVIFNEKIGFKTPIHGLINNAAFAYDDIVTNLNIDTLIKMYNVNVFAAMNLTKYAIRHMLLHNIKGGIVHISSISAHTGYKGLAMYASSKGAIEAFSKNTAREWGKRGIRSNCVVPGFMETNMSKNLTDAQKQRIYNRNSLKSATSLESVAETTLFLLSEKANSITGQSINVDCGTI